jgi:hypothetical protein
VALHEKAREGPGSLFAVDRRQSITQEPVGAPPMEVPRSPLEREGVRERPANGGGGGGPVWARTFFPVSLTD